MAVSAQMIAARVALMRDSLHARGQRVTAQRMEVLREIADTNAHPDVEQIYHVVRERVPGISLDTVYRTLATLTECGLVSRVSVTPGPMRYDGNTSPHDHFICTRCGAIHDIDEVAPARVSVSQQSDMPGTIDSVEVSVRGVCAECMASPGDA